MTWTCTSIAANRTDGSGLLQDAGPRAKSLLLSMPRGRQSGYSVVALSRPHSDDKIRQMEEYLQHNFDRDVSIDSLADRIGMGPRNFIRRFKAACRAATFKRCGCRRPRNCWSVAPRTFRSSVRNRLRGHRVLQESVQAPYRRHQRNIETAFARMSFDRAE
jgi:hypothetical protein